MTSDLHKGIPLSPIRLADARVVLEPAIDAHLTDASIAWLNDPEVVRYSELRHARHDRAECIAYRQAMSAGGHFMWGIFRAREGDHIGNITLTIDRINRVADLAILVGRRDLHGHGLGRAAWALVLDWACSLPGLRKVTAGTMAVNQAMLAIFQRTGMHFEGRRRAHFLLDGCPVDMLLYARFNAKG
jgi:[ribosomal protein S5]-alanine N-acetyltransferase